MTREDCLRNIQNEAYMSIPFITLVYKELAQLGYVPIAPSYSSNAADRFTFLWLILVAEGVEK